MELNTIYNTDCLKGLRELKDNSIDVIITSPPYNKTGLNGERSLKNSKYPLQVRYDNYDDNMSEGYYEQWQIEILNECYRVLKPNGSMFYNHKNRIVNGKGYISNPWSWVTKSNFLVRQEIIWDKTTTITTNRCRFIPSTEKIFWLTKTPKPDFYRTDAIHEVIRIAYDRKNPHPAPFPKQLVDTLLSCIPNDGTKVVLDPFIGSGTTALSAIDNNFNFIGFEISENYCKMANDKISEKLN